MLFAPGAGQVFWQSSSMLHIVAQLDGKPPPPEVVALDPPPEVVVLVVALDPPPEVVVLVTAFEPPMPPLVVVAVVVVDWAPPAPPVTAVSLPDAQATSIAALEMKRDTREALRGFTLVARTYASVSRYTMPSLRECNPAAPRCAFCPEIAGAGERNARGGRDSVARLMSARDESASPWRRFFALEPLDNRYPALHGLRVLAILSVLQIHVTHILSGDYAGKRNELLNERFIAESYWIFFGMDLFFMLSGFLIGSILLRSLELEGTTNIRRFYIRRIFRTFPSYWVVLTVLATTTTLNASQHKNLLLEYVYGTNFASLEPLSVSMIWGWSLALEEQFYLVVPLLFFVLYRLRRDSHRFALLLGLWALAPAIRLFIYHRGEAWTFYDLHLALYFRTHTRFDAMVAGILLVFVNKHYGRAITEWFKVPFHRGIVGVLSFSCLWPMHNPSLLGTDHALMVYVFLWGTITSVMYFGPLLMLLGGQGWVARVLSAPIFRRIATLGYGVYLVHMPIIYFWFMPAVRALDRHGVSMVLVWPLTLLALIVVSLSVAYAMHVFIEKPALWIRDRLAA